MERLLLFFSSILLSLSLNAQQLHHEMITSQGASIQLESGHYVSQTIGQQSITGNNEGLKIVQGFQQPFWNKLISDSILEDSIEISYYPNPVATNLNFNFINYLEGELNVMVFDFSGRLLIRDKINVLQGKSILNLSTLPSGTFLINIRNKNINYYTKIVKK